MSKSDIKAICKALFNDGVLTCKNDVTGRHPTINVPNLHVIQLMRSFESRGYIRRKYAWRHYYFYLTNEGIDFLREELHLPAEIIPATLKKTARPTSSAERHHGTGAGRGAQRDSYRRGPAAEKAAPAPAEFDPSFTSPEASA